MERRPEHTELWITSIVIVVLLCLFLTLLAIITQQKGMATDGYERIIQPAPIQSVPNHTR